MKCWHCNTELIWGGDHDIEEEDAEYCMETNLSCPQCNSFVMIYLPKDKMWKHYCFIEESDMEIGKEEECNWCGETESFVDEKKIINIEKDFRNDDSSS
jgi:DNA-directed RNA polymerase subunit RPC12/RpoP